MINYKNKNVLITGASNGIGRACAEAFAKAGARLILCGRHEQRLQTVSHQLSKDYATPVLPLLLDITDADAVKETIMRLPDQWCDIDLLINNAGMALGYEKLYAGEVRDWDRVIDTNIKGTVYMTRFVVESMVKRQQGHIINMGSISSYQTYPGGSVYCATKFAVRGFTDTLRMDLHGTPIRVSLIDPGLVKTDFFDVRLQGDSEKVAALFAGVIPLQPEDVADAVFYCATRPAHVTIHEMTIMPTDQTSALMTYRRKTDE